MKKASFARTYGLFAAVALAVGCSGSGSGGCGGLTPLPNLARYTGPKSDNALQVRLSPNGINYINSNWQQIIGLFAPGNVLTLPVGCIRQNVAVIGDLTISDQGGPGGGRLDGKCCPTVGSGCSANEVDLPAQVQATITGFALVPTPPDIIEATVTLSIATGKIYARTNSGNSLLCLFLSSAACSIDFNTGRAAPATNTLVAKVKFSIDTKWDKLLSFQVLTPIVGTDICTASGAPPPPKCLQPSDLDISGENTCGDIWCGLADWDVVKDLLLGLISPLLQTQINKAVAAQSCEACGAVGQKACPTVGTATSTCQNNVCMDTATSKCVPRFLGVEGRMALSSVLGGFGVPASAALDLSVAAGSPVPAGKTIVDQGINIGMRGGLKAVAVAPCVPPVAAPAMPAVNAPNFDDPLVAPSGYHVGLGISQPFMQLAFHEAQQAGALCIQVNSSTVGLINTGLFKTFLPSLGRLATRDGLDAPMMIVLKPARPPTVTVGLGTFDPVTKKPIKPLITVGLPDLTIDFYAMIDDRYARLFSLTADISLPLSLIFTGCDTVTPALGDLKTLITNIRTANSEMLAEDPKVLADLIPAVIGLAEPALSGALKGFTLPQLGQFKLKVNKTTGLSQITGTENYNHLGIYATLMPLNAACAVASPQTVVALKQSIMPNAADMKLVGKPLPWPVAVLDVHALGGSGTPEFAYRIDEGMWSTFLAPNSRDELEVSHPVFLMQGNHQIEVRSRWAEDAHGISSPVTVGFRVDWEPPEVSLQIDREADRVRVAAHDVISAPAALQYAYAVGQGGAFSEFGAEREIMFSAIEQQGGVTVRVKDEMGNVGEASWKVPQVALRPEVVSDTAGPAASGCSTAFGLPGAALLALASLLRRRRR